MARCSWIWPDVARDVAPDMGRYDQMRPDVTKYDQIWTNRVRYVWLDMVGYV